MTRAVPQPKPNTPPPKTGNLKTAKKSNDVSRGPSPSITATEVIHRSRRGGRRANSGRKPKLKDDARKAFYAAVDERWNKILEVLDFWIERKDKFVLLAILEQRIGKAPQTMKLGGDPQNKAPIRVGVIKVVQPTTRPNGNGGSGGNG